MSEQVLSKNIDPSLNNLYILMNKNKLTQSQSLKNKLQQKKLSNNEKYNKQIFKQSYKFQQKDNNNLKINTSKYQQLNKLTNNNIKNLKVEIVQPKIQKKVQLQQCTCQTSLQIPSLSHQKQDFIQQNQLNQQISINQDNKLLYIPFKFGQNNYLGGFNIQKFTKFFNFIVDFKLMKCQPYIPSNQLIQSESQNQLNGKNLTKKFNKNTSFDSQIANKQNQQQEQLQFDQQSLIDIKMSTSSNDSDNCQFISDQVKKQYSSNPKIQYNKNRNSSPLFLFQSNKLKQSNNTVNPLTKSQNLRKTQTRIVPLSQLKQKINQEKKKQSLMRHQGFFCDQCHMEPIIGKRYKCIQCQNYDLCNQCYQIQCLNYGSIMELSPLPTLKKKCHKKPIIINEQYLKRNMSKISQQANSLKLSSQTQTQNQNQNCVQTLPQHLHIMEEVKKSRYLDLLNLSKVLHQSSSHNCKAPLRRSRKRINVGSEHRQKQNNKKSPSPEMFRGKSDKNRTILENSQKSQNQNRLHHNKANLFKSINPQ